MKLTTQVCVAIRNIGQATDKGDIFEGSLKESIEYIARRLVNTTMARRVVIGIGRDREGAIIAIQDRKTQSRSEQEDELLEMLNNSVFAEGATQEDDYQNDEESEQ